MRILNILKANSEISSLTAKVEELSALNESLKKENDELKAKATTSEATAQSWAAEKEALVKAHEEALKTLVEKHDKELKDLQISVKEASESAGKKAAEIVAAVGVEPETVKPAKGDLVGGERGAKSRFTITTYKK